MTRAEIKAVQESVRRLREIKETLCGDPEHAHSQADQTLLTLLRAIGLREVAEAWENVEPKWYA